MNKDIEIITIKALSDNYIWLLRNHLKKLSRNTSEFNQKITHQSGSETTIMGIHISAYT